MSYKRKQIPTQYCRSYIGQMYKELGKTRNLLTDNVIPGSTDSIESILQARAEILQNIDKMALMLGLFEEQIGKHEYFEPGYRGDV